MIRKREFLFLPVLVLWLALCLGGCGPKPAADIGVSPDQPLLRYFRETHPDNPVILCAAGDVNADGREDLIVIYNVGKEINRMCVVLAGDGGRHHITNEVPAPVEDQKIEFKDIDGKPPVEFIVQGAKGARTGLAVYRVTDGVLNNLFGDNMPDCCN